MALLPSLQGRALYEANVYTGGDLPSTTQERVLPKAAAEAVGTGASLHDTHLAVEPSSRELVWTGEREGDPLSSRASASVSAQPLDRVDGAMERVAGGFTPPVSRVLAGSLQWRAYDRHWFTRVEDAAIVPLGGGRAVAIAPYIRYRGFPVRHPYWAGVYVYHQDGRMEDLSPRQAMARPELVRSGRLFPEELARDIAEAYGYRNGAAAVVDDGARTEVSDPPGNPQPYLTNLGDGQVRWVTVAHPADDGSRVSAVFLTDSGTGATEVWRAPRGTRLLSNTGAADLVRRLPLQWWDSSDAGDPNGSDYWVHKVVEPTPVFSNGRLQYVVSILANPKYLPDEQPVSETVVVDAARARIVEQEDHLDD
jgi:hypothetical protein